jgi:hypothetical protein
VEPLRGECTRYELILALGSIGSISRVSILNGMPVWLVFQPIFFSQTVETSFRLLEFQWHQDSDIYVDDSLISVDRSCVTYHKDFTNTIQVLEDLGFAINFDESDFQDSTRKKFIGYVFDALGPDGKPWLFMTKDNYVDYLSVKRVFFTLII